MRPTRLGGHTVANPGAQGFVMVKARDQRLAVDFEHWPTVVYGDLLCTVGALVHRANAVVDLG